MIVFNKYVNSRDYTWYDSSNVIYSECIDTNQAFKTVKLVFKGGRQYIYHNVDPTDYLMFRNAESNGKAFSTYIKKYECQRLPDISIEELNEKRKGFEEDNRVTEEAFTNLSYLLEMNPNSKEIRLSLNGNVIFEGVEDKVNIMRLLKCMSINYQFKEMEETTDGQEQSESGSQKTDGLE